MAVKAGPGRAWLGGAVKARRGKVRRVVVGRLTERRSGQGVDRRGKAVMECNGAVRPDREWRSRRGADWHGRAWRSCYGMVWQGQPFNHLLTSNK
jgi:hypothetical protein